jgi:hypothetical protein
MEFKSSSWPCLIVGDVAILVFLCLLLMVPFFVMRGPERLCPLASHHLEAVFGRVSSLYVSTCCAVHELFLRVQYWLLESCDSILEFFCTNSTASAFLSCHIDILVGCCASDLEIRSTCLHWFGWNCSYPC